MATFTGNVEGGISIGGSAAVGFTHGSGPVDNDLVFEWDLDGDGDFDQPEENVTAYIVDGNSRTGRDFPSQINGKAGPGSLRLTARNDDNRFNHFNTASPLNTAPFSLGTGRAFRVRTSTSSPVDPVLKAKDRFDGPGDLGVDETGKTWTNQTANLWTRNGTGGATATLIAGEAIATVDIGVSNCFVQATRLDGGVAVIYRFTDVNNFGYVWFASGTLFHITRTAGVETQHETYAVSWRYGPATLGALVNGSTITGYLGGVPVFTGSTALSSSATKVGIAGFLTTNTALDFRAWTTVPAEVEGVLWTGDVTSVNPSVDRNHDKTAEIVAEGRLAKAAIQQVETASHLFGIPTGIQVGEVLSAAELAQPPGLIDLGDVTTGAVHFERGQALELARRLEETEIGFLYEMQEGPIGYEKRSARSAATPTGLWSDAAGAQFQFEEIELLDFRQEIFNRALAGLAPRCMTWPPPEAFDSASTAAGVANDVLVTMPTTVNEGDLLLVLIASTVVTSGRQWSVPHGWKQIINESDSIRLRAYAKVALGSEASTNVLFYDDGSPNAGGLWIAEIRRIPKGQWFGSLEGVAQAPCVVADVVAGDNPSKAYTPPALPVPWGREPTYFLVARAGLGSVLGGTGGAQQSPPGYLSGVSADQDGAANQFDIGFHLAAKIDSLDTETPGAFGSDGFGGYLVVCATTIAVRGWNGDPPLNNGRQVVQVDDLASQTRHNMVRTYPTIPELFASTADANAYASRITALYGNDRPIFSITFTANKTAAYRQQAIRRRVGDMIHLTANGTGADQTGMGVDGDFFIENIRHRWSDGGKLWTVTWELSPA